MWTRALAVFAIFPFALLIALFSALPSPARALGEVSAATGSIPMPTLQLEWAEGTLVLSGVVPDAAERQAMAQRAVSIYGRTQVVDKLHVAAVANPRWLSPQFMPDLRALSSAVASLEDARIVIAGVAPTPQAHQQVEAWLVGAGRAGLVVVNRVTYGQPVPLR